jgi:prevent-host-death family protein
MKRIYSVYEAKAKFSEIVRAVRERGDTITISYHGEPVAEMRPIESAGTPAGKRIAELEASGVLVPAEVEKVRLPDPIVRRRGALERFLAERDN